MYTHTTHASPAVHRRIIISAAYILLCACMALTSACSPTESQETGTGTRKTPVTTTPVIRSDIETHMHLTGTIQPDREAFLGPKVAGRIESFFADTGDHVSAGQLLLQLEKERFELAAQEARAALEETTGNLAHLESTLQRYQQLYADGVLDKQLLDDTATSAVLARARAEIARTRFERARMDLQDATLQAPFAGFVVERRMNAGEFYSTMPNEYVFHLVDTSTAVVEVNIIETKKRSIATGLTVEITVDALPDTTWPGTITVVNPRIDPASRKFLVKIEIPNESFVLEAGMFARVRIPERRRENTLLIPTRAIAERDNRMLAFVAEDGHARQREIELGMITPDQIEIISGLHEGEAVIVEGLYAVQDGTPVRIDG